MIHRSTKLRKGQNKRVVDERRKRLQEILFVGGPDIVVIAMAENYLRSFRWSWSGIWQHFKCSKFPQWLLWVTDRDYRAVCRDTEGNEKFEREMREMMAPRVKHN